MIREELEAGSDMKRLCGRVIEGVDQFTVERFKLSSLNSVSVSVKGLSPKETLKTCDSNFLGLIS